MCKLELVGAQSLIFNPKVGIVFEVKFKNSFRHSRIIFSKKFELRICQSEYLLKCKERNGTNSKNLVNLQYELKLL